MSTDRPSRITIIFPDNMVVMDSLSVPVELPTPKNIRSIQWMNSMGFIEYDNGVQNKTLEGDDDYNAFIAPYVVLAREASARHIQAAIDHEKKQEEQRVKNLEAARQQLASDPKYMRIRRNELLDATEWTQNNDNELTEASKEEFRLYRRALRRLPEHPDFPNVEFPVQPTPVKKEEDSEIQSAE